MSHVWVIEEKENGLKVLVVNPSFIRTNISQSALLGDGTRNDEEDPRLEKGMSAPECAHSIVQAIRSNRKQVIIGWQGKVAVGMKRYFPWLFFQVMKKKG